MMPRTSKCMPAPRRIDSPLRASFVRVAFAVVLACAAALVPCKAFATVSTYEDMVTQTRTLEGYANDYIAANPGATDANGNRLNASWLVPAYIRSIRYPDAAWINFGGGVPDDFVTYCAGKDTASGSDVQSLRTMGTITLPNGDSADAIHMFAVIDGGVFSGTSSAGADLTSWIGDTNDLLRDVSDASGGVDSSDVTAAYALAAEKFNISGRFGPEDLKADLDGCVIAARRVASGSAGAAPTSYGDLLDAYFTKGLTNDARVQAFCAARLPTTALTRDAYRSAVQEAYSSNTYVTGLEQLYGLTSQTNSRTGSCDVVADYLLGYMPVTLDYSAATNGSVTSASESVEAGNGTAEGSTAVPDAGYHLVAWSDASGAQVSTTETLVPTKSETGFYVSGAYVATFAENDPVTIAYAASTGGTVTSSSESVAPATGTASGSTATPNAGYHFLNWTNAAGDIVSTSAEFQPSKVGGAYVGASYTANFAADPVVPAVPVTPVAVSGSSTLSTGVPTTSDAFAGLAAALPWIVVAGVAAVAAAVVIKRRGRK